MFEEIRDPAERCRAVTAFASHVVIDPSIPAKRLVFVFIGIHIFKK